MELPSHSAMPFAVVQAAESPLLMSVPRLVAPVLIGTAAGLSGARWLSDRHFAIALHVLLLAAGVGAVLSALI